MKTDDLLRLADALDGLHPEGSEFNMYVWGSEEPGCGFAGCAIGWGHRLGVLPEGLTLIAPGVDDNEDEYNPAFGDSTSWYAVADAYEITSTVAEHLFDVDGYDVGDPSPQQVAERIREFVAGTS